MQAQKYIHAVRNSWLFCPLGQLLFLGNPIASAYASAGGEG
jgi:hypothetical protein